jgi:hypothetical protein
MHLCRVTRIRVAEYLKDVSLQSRLTDLPAAQDVLGHQWEVAHGRHPSSQP